MDTIKPFIRWIAAGIALAAIVFAYLAPHRADVAAAPDDSPPPLAASAVSSAMPSAMPSETPAALAVYVCGAIRNRGVYHLASGSRVVDAVNAAGGLGSDADPEAINLAAPLSDGMKIDVPKKGAAVNDFSGAAGPYAPPPRSARHSARRQSFGRTGRQKLQPGQSLDINTASESELTQLPGVGSSLARRIVEYRTANGPFAVVEDLQNVSGVGAGKFAKMEPFLRI